MNGMMLASIAAIVAGSAPVFALTVERVAPDAMRRVAPGLAEYTDRVLFGDVWSGTRFAPATGALSRSRP
jgi:4-carboxymuconolactone decarboxylase